MNEEGRPKAAPESPATATTHSVTRSAPDAPLDLLTLTPRERAAYDTGRLWGYVEGHEAGARWADERAATLHREAVRVVHRLAGLPEVRR